MKMALFHDLAESVIGDIPTFANVPKGRHCDNPMIFRKLTNIRTEERNGAQRIPISRKLAAAF